MTDQLEFERGEHKALGRIEIKNEEKGEVRAVFSTFNVIDHDGDVTLPGAFENGAKVTISAYGHKSWMGELPVGRGVIAVDEDRAVLDGKFFLSTEAGRETFETVKAMGDLQEWSYGFDVLEVGKVDDLPEELNGAFRVLSKLKVHEVSPVLLGAGIDTRTLAVKHKEPQAIEPEPEQKLIDDMATEAIKELARFERTRARLLFRTP